MIEMQQVKDTTTAAGALLTHPLTMLVLGVVANQLNALSAASKEAGEPISPVQYVKDKPYRCVLSLVGAVIGYGVLIDTGQLTAVAAVGVGFAGAEVINWVSDWTRRKMGR